MGISRTRLLVISISILALAIAAAVFVLNARDSLSQDALTGDVSITLEDIRGGQLYSDYERGYELYRAEDYRSARLVLAPLGRAGLVEARYLVGRMHALGLGVDKDLSEARRWIDGVVNFYRAAAMRDQVNAQYHIGEIYLDTIGVDWQEAYKWTARAALKGHSGAQYNLSKLYFSRRGESINPDALYWLRVAAKGGNRDAQYDLGYRLASGRGMEKNSNDARMWLEKASSQGHPQARDALRVFGLAASN
jgi:hypothetical protein